MFRFVAGGGSISSSEPPYFCPVDLATDTLEESKTGTTKSWIRFNCARVILFAHLTKSSSQGKFSCSHQCYNLFFPKQFFFLWPLIDVFSEARHITWKDCLRRPKMYIYLNAANRHLLVPTTRSVVLRMSIAACKLFERFSSIKV